jgi:hypothetical protein
VNPLDSLKGVAVSVLTRLWAMKDHPPSHEPVYTTQPGDNLQRSMNLIMPLKDRSLQTRAALVAALASATDVVLTGLDNVGTVHDARFVIVDGNLCMFSIYDGDFANYIRDFIMTIGPAFDALLAFVEHPAPTPTEAHVEEFIEWVHRHDALALPDNAISIADDLPDLDDIERAMLVTLQANPNVVLGVYRRSPGYSTAQIRQALGIGW